MIDQKARQELEATAHHEAGHAVIRWRLGYPITHASIIAKGRDKGEVEGANPLGILDPHAEDVDDALLGDLMRSNVKITLAGPTAQERFDPASVEDVHSEKDREAVSDLIMRLSWSPESIQPVAEALKQETRELVEKHWQEVEGVARLLLKRREVTGEELTRFLEIMTGEAVPVRPLFKVTQTSQQAQSPNNGRSEVKYTFKQVPREELGLPEERPVIRTFKQVPREQED